MALRLARASLANDDESAQARPGEEDREAILGWAEDLIALPQPPEPDAEDVNMWLAVTQLGRTTQHIVRRVDAAAAPPEWWSALRTATQFDEDLKAYQSEPSSELLAQLYAERTQLLSQLQPFAVLATPLDPQSAAELPRRSWGCPRGCSAAWNRK
jgi:hypothetical protein